MKKKTLWIVLLCAALVGCTVPPLSDFLPGDALTRAADRIEAAGPADVLYLSVEPSERLGSNNMVVKIAYLYHVVPPEEIPHQVRLTANGYDIIAGYDWSPGDARVDHLWSVEKAQHYSRHAMFKPGQHERVAAALDGMVDWYRVKVFCEWLKVICEEAVKVGGDWKAVELHRLVLSGPYPVPVVTMDGERTYGLAYPAQDRVVAMVWRTCAEEIAAADELSHEAYQGYRDANKISFEFASPVYGSVPWLGGFNHPWRGPDR